MSARLGQHQRGSGSSSIRIVGEFELAVMAFHRRPNDEQPQAAACFFAGGKRQIRADVFSQARTVVANDDRPMVRLLDQREHNLWLVDAAVGVAECFDCILEQIDQGDLQLDRITVDPGRWSVATVQRGRRCDPCPGDSNIRSDVHQAVLDDIAEVQTDVLSGGAAQHRFDLIGDLTNPLGLFVQHGDLPLHLTRKGLLSLGVLRPQEGLCSQFDDAQRLIDFMGNGGGFQADLQFVAHEGQGLFVLGVLFADRLSVSSLNAFTMA